MQHLGYAYLDSRGTDIGDLLENRTGILVSREVFKGLLLTGIELEADNHILLHSAHHRPLKLYGLAKAGDDK